MKRFLFLLLMLTAVSAHSDEPAPIVFPEWTYWVEIFEHAITFIISVGAMALLSKRKSGGKFAIAGFGVFALAEFFTILHHFLVYPFGIWNSIVNHGLLLLALVFMAYAFIGRMKKE